MTRTIRLQGRMGELFGEVHRLNCKTVQEAMHAIDMMKGGLRTYLMDCTENGVHFTVQKGEDFLDNQTVGVELGEDDIIISPIPAGSNKVVKFIIGVLLIIGAVMMGDPATLSKGMAFLQSAMFTIGIQLALSGIIEMTMDEPDELDEQKSTMFNGPINNTKSGIPVPIAYGKLEVGGAVVNFGFTDYRITGNEGYTFVGKGTSNSSGYISTSEGGGASGGSSSGLGNNVQIMRK